MLFNDVFSKRELLLGLAVLWAGVGAAWAGQALSETLSREAARTVFTTPGHSAARYAMMAGSSIEDAAPLIEVPELAGGPPLAEVAPIAPPPDVSLPD